MDRILVDGMRLVDEHGRERILSGMNICDKRDYDKAHPGLATNADNFPFEEFRARGYDVIRLGFTWSMMEPIPGKYNEELIKSICEFLDKAEEYGAYVYLDCHQDVYSSYCYGDGAPRWATITDCYTPTKPLAVWAEPYCYGKACFRAFDNFWANRKVKGKGLQDYYADCWSHIVEKLGDKPAVIGALRKLTAEGKYPDGLWK